MHRWAGKVAKPDSLESSTVNHSWNSSCDSVQCQATASITLNVKLHITSPFLSSCPSAECRNQAMKYSSVTLISITLVLSDILKWSNNKKISAFKNIFILRSKYLIGKIFELCLKLAKCIKWPGETKHHWGTHRKILGFGTFPILLTHLIYEPVQIVLETKHLLLYTFSSELLCSCPPKELAREYELWWLHVCWICLEMWNNGFLVFFLQQWSQGTNSWVALPQLYEWDWG